MTLSPHPFFFFFFFNIPPLLELQVGHTDSQSERTIGQALAEYIHSPDNLFIISSDFCHWGARFGFTYLPSEGDVKDKKIWERIQDMDLEGVDHIISQSPRLFRDYLERTGNTIW